MMIHARTVGAPDGVPTKLTIPLTKRLLDDWIADAGPLLYFDALHGAVFTLRRTRSGPEACFVALTDPDDEDRLLDAARAELLASLP